MPDVKSGKRREVEARLSWQTACTVGFRGDLRDWERFLSGDQIGRPVGAASRERAVIGEASRDQQYSFLFFAANVVHWRQ